MKKIVPILSIIMGCYWIVFGIKYGFWVRKGPGGGFLPVLAGIMAVIFAVAMLKSQKKEASQTKFTWKAFLPIVAVAGMLLVSYVVGLILSIAMYVFLWLKYVEKYKISKSFTIGVCCAGVIYGIFVAWLRVPLPSGIVGLF